MTMGHLCSQKCGGRFVGEGDKAGEGLEMPNDTKVRNVSGMGEGS